MQSGGSLNLTSQMLALHLYKIYILLFYLKEKKTPLKALSDSESAKTVKLNHGPNRESPAMPRANNAEKYQRSHERT